ncbi:MAG: 50S ribosomal protein L25 [Acidimicrobiia bacterium]|nr:50S ribosomal protein L25 [Acidimicrobiia bacterium]
MQQETLHATKRVTSGSRASNRLRREGRVPGVVYGASVDAQPIHVSARDLYAVLRTEAGLNAIIEVDMEGDSVLTVAREIQRHPVRGEITHLDFIEVRMDTEIEAEVAIEYLGIPLGVREDGGIVETIEASITISALPNAIPSSIEVSVEDMAMFETLKVSDLPEVDGVTYLADDDSPLLTVVAPAAEVEEPAIALEGEEGELVEGDEAADEAADADVEDEG